jgi:UDP:flavonoid glycosyltransferase YjiC (YdhE family)
VKHLTILAYGSRGDVQPYVALGFGLKQADYSVKVAAPVQFQSLVLEYGLDFAPLAGDPRILMTESVDKANSPCNFLNSTRVILRYAAPIALQVLKDAECACQGTDVIVHSLLMTQVGHQIALQLSVPDFSALVFPVFTPTKTFPNPGFPDMRWGLYNRLTHHLFTQLFSQGGRLAYEWIIRGRHSEFPPLAEWPFNGSSRRTTPILYSFSPQIIPKPADWSKDVYVTGYWFVPTPSHWQPPADLVDFIAAGSKPVFVGFGSVVSRHARQLTEIVLEALSRTGQRGVLLSGWGGLSKMHLPENVLMIESAPFDWLFPQMRAAVIHGGIGTTAASMQAGIPTIVVPFTADQFFWGDRVFHLGVGPKPVPYRKLNAVNLAETIRQSLEDECMQQRANQVGQFLRAEDGVSNAIQIIEKYLEV